MPGLLERLFGPPKRDYQAGPKLAGLDAVSERAVELQRRYWSADPAELAALEGRGLGELDWADALRLHHLRCLALLDADGGTVRRELLAPEDERPGAAALQAPAIAAARELAEASARHLLGRRSPFRPRHGFAWLGDGPPAGEAVPYSDFQGRTLNASLSHLGCLEVLTLDDELQPAAVAFVSFDAIVTLAVAPREAPSEAGPPFRPARILREYGEADQLVLVPLRYGLSWFAHAPELLRGPGERGVAATQLSGLADPTKVVQQPSGDRRPLTLRAGRQRIEILSDFAQEGLGSFALGEGYQLSLAIDQDDPRFDDKCRGRGIDPNATRGDVVRESRLRASARQRRREG